VEDLEGAGMKLKKARREKRKTRIMFLSLKRIGKEKTVETMNGGIQKCEA
jgi:hypothetical protein